MLLSAERLGRKDLGKGFKNTTKLCRYFYVLMGFQTGCKVSMSGPSEPNMEPRREKQN